MTVPNVPKVSGVPGVKDPIKMRDFIQAGERPLLR